MDKTGQIFVLNSSYQRTSQDYSTLRYTSRVLQFHRWWKYDSRKGLWTEHGEGHDCYTYMIVCSKKVLRVFSQLMMLIKLHGVFHRSSRFSSHHICTICDWNIPCYQISPLVSAQTSATSKSPKQIKTKHWSAPVQVGRQGFCISQDSQILQ